MTRPLRRRTSHADGPEPYVRAPRGTKVVVAARMAPELLARLDAYRRAQTPPEDRWTDREVTRAEVIVHLVDWALAQAGYPSEK